MTEKTQDDLHEDFHHARCLVINRILFLKQDGEAKNQAEIDELTTLFNKLPHYSAEQIDGVLEKIQAQNKAGRLA